MNAERLHAIANSLKAELTQSETPALMQQLIQNLQQLVQNPAQPGPQQIVSDTRQQLDQRVADAPSNHWSPAWRQAVEELGVADILGEQLRARIATVFERNEITPTAAANELAPIADRLTQLDAALDQLRASFGFFNIGAEELAPGEGEVGFLIPRARVENELGALGEEFTRVKAILAPFLELTTGSRPDVVVRSISSSEFQVLVYAMPVTVLMLAKALDTLISAYQKVIDIRLARQKLKDAGASKGNARVGEPGR